MKFLHTVSAVSEERPCRDKFDRNGRRRVQWKISFPIGARHVRKLWRENSYTDKQKIMIFTEMFFISCSESVDIFIHFVSIDSALREVKLALYFFLSMNKLI